MLRNALHNGRLLLIAGCAMAAVAAAGALRADLMVSHSFGKVLGSQSAPQPFESAAGAPTYRTISRVGDEGYWLNLAAEAENLSPFAKRLAVGDRITISGQDGRQRILEVTDTKVLGEPLTKVAAGAAPNRLVLVTCRIVDGSERETNARVRFIIDGESSETPAVQPPSHPKTL